MTPEEKITALEKKLDAVYVSVEKTRKYLQITMWVTIVVFVLPLVGLFFAIPAFIATFSQISSLGGIGTF